MAQIPRAQSSPPEFPDHHAADESLMVWHARSAQRDEHVVIGFSRRDALVRETAPLPGVPPCFHPVPVPTGDGRLFGPSVADVVVPHGEIVRLASWDELLTPLTTGPSVADAARSDISGLAASHVPGTPVDARGDFEIVDKPGHVSVHRLTVRLASAMYGGEADARHHIAALAAYAGEFELERSLLLYMAARDGGPLDPALMAQRAVEEDVENQVVREACAHLGVNPEARGAARTPAGDAGEEARGTVVRLLLRDDGTVHGELLAARCGHGPETALHALTVGQLVDLLESVRAEGLADDADLLTAYLDGAHPGWRERGAARDGPKRDPRTGNVPDPFEVLGLDRATATMDDIKRAYRHAIKAAHPDTSGLPPWFAQTLNHAYDAAAATVQQDLSA